MKRAHRERHRLSRTGWLRAAVLGANDGIVSTASLILGVAAADVGHANIMTAGTAALVAGALSMAAGEYVSVHSQADSEGAELERERAELANDATAELQELASIYVSRGLQPELTRHDALAAHARDELGISEAFLARPLQAAGASAASFAVGASLPLLVAWLAPGTTLIASTAVTCLLFLAMLGAIAARAGGASMLRGAARVTVWGALAMGITFAIGKLFGAVV